MSVAIPSQWRAHSLFVPEQKMRTNKSFLFSFGDFSFIIIAERMERKQCSTKKANKTGWDALGKASLVHSSCVYNCTKDVISFIKKKNRHFSLLPAEIHLWGK